MAAAALPGNPGSALQNGNTSKVNAPIPAVFCFKIILPVRRTLWAVNVQYPVPEQETQSLIEIQAGVLESPIASTCAEAQDGASVAETRTHATFSTVSCSRQPSVLPVAKRVLEMSEWFVF